jgi:alpha,alpha-trehalase
MNIPEKFDLEISSHKVLLNMEMLEQVWLYRKEGFGWVNASYQYGLQILNKIKN